MKSITSKILILGATGMLGRMIYKYLSRKHHNVYGTSKKHASKFIFFNARNTNRKLEKIFVRIKPEYVINCIGILRDENKKNLKYINSKFPRIISQISKNYDFKVINISTDAVFGDLQGKVNEDSIPIPDGKYGKSKIAGEQKINTLNIRTSFIGLDPSEHKGILEFLMKNRNNYPIGYVNQKWSGATTLQLAKFFEDLIYNKNFEKIFKKTNVIHYAPIHSNKYEIFKTFTNLLELKKPKRGLSNAINRILKSQYISVNKLKEYGTNLGKALKDLIKYEHAYVKNYKKN